MCVQIFGEVVLGLSQGSVSELLSKPKPWHMLSIKGREPFIRMQLWLTDPQNIEKLQALKNERREANKRRRTNHEDGSKRSQESPLYNFSNNSSGYSPLPTGQGSFNTSFGGSSSAKKPRILFSDEQKEALRLAFSMDPYPSTATIEFLAGELALSVRTITNWFHNHRMRLKQVSNASNDESGPVGAVGNVNSLPFGLGRDGVSFDPINFRVLLNQRMVEARAQSSSDKNKYSGLYGNSAISSLYGNPNSCSSPGSSSFQEDDIGTLDLSMSSQQHKNRSSLAGDTDESDGDVDDDEDDCSVELDLSRTSKSVGSSRRKPQIVMSSSSRRKPAQPQWVDPGLEFSGDEDDEDLDDDAMSGSDLDDDSPATKARNEIINGVCVRQTDYGHNALKRRASVDDEPISGDPASANLVQTLSELKEKMQRHEQNVKKLQSSLEKEEDDWEDDGESLDGAQEDGRQTKDLPY